jgi:hypothetical protein
MQSHQNLHSMHTYSQVQGYAQGLERVLDRVSFITLHCATAELDTKIVCSHVFLHKNLCLLTVTVPVHQCAF